MNIDRPTPFVSLQAAIAPSVLLDLLARTAPVADEPSLAAASLDEDGQVTVYCNACRRLGMRFHLAPTDLLALSGRAPAEASPAGTGFTTVLANLVELAAIYRARGTQGLVEADYAPWARTGDTHSRAVLEPATRLSFAEHEALYTGLLPVTVTAAGRTRLWQVSPRTTVQRPQCKLVAADASLLPDCSTSFATNQRR